MQTKLSLFEQKEIRKLWSSEKSDWYFSIVDIIEVLTDSNQPRKYWSYLKIKLSSEGSQLSEKIGQLKMKAQDGKMRLTDVANTKTMSRVWNINKGNLKMMVRYDNKGV